MGEAQDQSASASSCWVSQHPPSAMARSEALSVHVRFYQGDSLGFSFFWSPHHPAKAFDSLRVSHGRQAAFQGNHRDWRRQVYLGDCPEFFSPGLEEGWELLVQKGPGYLGVVEEPSPDRSVGKS
jgi:hypothetical protein